MTKKTLQAKAFEALKEAVREVVEEHRRSGRPLSVWRNGKVVKISANEALRKNRQETSSRQRRDSEPSLRSFSGWNFGF